MPGDGRRTLVPVGYIPPAQGRLQRRVIQVQVDGRLEWREFDVVRVFDDEQEARAWAEKEGIPFEGESR